MSDKPLKEIGADNSLLIVDDDEPFLRRLARAMEKRGFEVETADSVAAGTAIATARPPAYAVVDLRLEDGNGLDVVERIHTAHYIGTVRGRYLHTIHLYRGSDRGVKVLRN